MYKHMRKALTALLALLLALSAAALAESLTVSVEKTAGEGENTILPMLIAEGIDSAGENAGSASEKDGVLTIKTEADGSACTVTADSSTGDILTFRSPGNKLAVFFSDVSPYTEEVGVIE